MSALSSYKGQIHLMRQINEASYYIGKAEELGQTPGLPTSLVTIKQPEMSLPFCPPSRGFWQ